MFNSIFIILQATVLKKSKILSTRDYQRNRNQSRKVKHHIKMCMQHCQWRTVTLPSSEYLVISRDMPVGMIGENVSGVLETALKDAAPIPKTVQYDEERPGPMLQQYQG